MKIKIYCLLASLLVVLILAGACTSAPAPAPAPTPTAPAPESEKFEVTMSVPYLTGIVGESVTLFADDLRKMSNGRLDITNVTWGTIVPFGDEYRALGDGTMKMSWVVADMYTGEYPMAMVESGIPGTLRDYHETQVFLWDKGAAQLFQDENAKRNVKWLGAVPFTCEGFISKVPINSINDVKGLKFRCGGLLAEVMTNFGAGAVSSPPSEIYTMLATGAVDAATMSGAPDNYEYGFQEVTKYWQAAPKLRDIYCFSIDANMDFWNSLPQDIQLMMEQEAKVVGERFWRTYDTLEKETLNKVQQENGIIVQRWSDDDMKLWFAAVKDIIQSKYMEDPATAQALEVLWAYMAELGR